MPEQKYSLMDSLTWVYLMKLKLILVRSSNCNGNDVLGSCFSTVLSQSSDPKLFEGFSHTVSFRLGIHSFYSQLVFHHMC